MTPVGCIGAQASEPSKPLTALRHDVLEVCGVCTVDPVKGGITRGISQRTDDLRINQNNRK
jgi:hypothetical protein